jgi:nitrilase
MPPARVAVVQAGSALFDTPRTLDRLATRAADAAGRGAKLAVFPEACVGRYAKGLGFGVRLGTHTPEGREEFRR